MGILRRKPICSIERVTISCSNKQRSLGIFCCQKRNTMHATIYCRVSAGSTSYISNFLGWSHASSLTSPGQYVTIPPALVEKPSEIEMAPKGGKKVMRCIPTGNPVPQIVWLKEGKLNAGGWNGIELQSFNRILVIKNVEARKHEGKYQCGYRRKGTLHILATTVLHVTGPPVMVEFPQRDVNTDESKSFSLHCKARQLYSSYQDTLYYDWYKNGKPLTSTRRKVILNKNALTVNATRADDSGVYQCVARDNQGMTTTATRVHIYVKTCKPIAPPSNSKFKEGFCHIQSSFDQGSRCTVLCDRGFFGKGHRGYRKCMDDGGCSVMQYVCEDHEPPTLKKGHGCPKDIVIATKRNNNTGMLVSWKPPMAEDNSGKLVTRIRPQGIKGNSHWFPLGTNAVRYTFVDPSGQNVSCQFIVTVFLRTQIITKPLSLVYILRDKPLVLTCIAESHSSPYYIWRRSKFTEPDKNNEIINGSSVQLLDGRRRLVISHVSENDSGKYTCEAIDIYFSAPGVRDTVVISVEIVKEIEWSPWQPWTSRKVKTCGKGLKTRKRVCLKKDTPRIARGCDGENSQSEGCTLLCTTPTPQTTVPSTKKDVLPEVDSVKNVFIKYEGQARGWINDSLPELLKYLSTTNGKIVFACVFCGVGIFIILMCWARSHFIGRRKKKRVQFADVKTNQSSVRKDENGNKEAEGKTGEDKRSPPLSDDLPVHEPQVTAECDEYDYDGVGYYDDNHPEYVNAEGYGYHYEKMYEEDDDDEMIYEEMAG